jgi:hypothetical protein
LVTHIQADAEGSLISVLPLEAPGLAVSTEVAP